MRKVCLLLLVLLVLTLVGCTSEQKLTEEQWVERYKPETLEQAEAMAVLNTAKVEAESKAKTLETMNKFKIACAIGFVGAIIAIGIGVWLRMKLFVGGGCVGIMACLAGYGLACADIIYGKWVAVGGLVLGVVVGGITIFIVVRALMEIIKGNEIFKGDLSDQTKDAFRIIHSSKSGGVQHALTEKIVSIGQRKLERRKKNA